MTEPSRRRPSRSPIRVPAVRCPVIGGITGLLQTGALEVLDQAACRLHTSREELVLALASPAEAKRFAAAHDGINPHSIISPLISLFGH